MRAPSLVIPSVARNLALPVKMGFSGTNQSEIPRWALSKITAFQSFPRKRESTLEPDVDPRFRGGDDNSRCVGWS
jgi:hypothetical protein